MFWRQEVRKIIQSRRMQLNQLGKQALTERLELRVDLANVQGHAIDLNERTKMFYKFGFASIF
jgi:hypothetical protein